MPWILCSSPAAANGPSPDPLKVNFFNSVAGEAHLRSGHNPSTGSQAPLLRAMPRNVVRGS